MSRFARIAAANLAAAVSGECEADLDLGLTVNLDEIDLKRMASKRCPGLFLCGEICDVDGIKADYKAGKNVLPLLGGGFWPP